MNTLLNHPKVPRYVKIAEELRGRIHDGKLKPGDRLPSFHEMRLQFGVHQPILDRAYRLLEEDGLLQRRPGSGTYVAEPKARARTGLIGFSGVNQPTGVRDPYWAHMIEGMRSVLEPEGNHLVLLPHDSGQGFEKVDGAILAAMQPDQVLAFLPPELPYVSMLRAFADFPCVRADDSGGGRAVAEYFLRLGHRRIATLGGGLLFEERRSGLEAVMRGVGIEPNASWRRQLRFPGYPYGAIAQGREEMRLWLREGFKETGCTALFVQNDDFAIGVLDALREAGVLVPEQVSVVGFDSTEMCEVATPRLTSVRVPLFDIGAQAARKILRLLNGEEVEPEEVMPAVVEERDSTAPVAASKNELVAA